MKKDPLYSLARESGYGHDLISERADGVIRDVARPPRCPGSVDLQPGGYVVPLMELPRGRDQLVVDAHFDAVYDLAENRGPAAESQCLVVHLELIEEALRHCTRLRIGDESRR